MSFNKWWSEYGKNGLPSILPHGRKKIAKDAWDAALKSVEGQKPTTNKQNTPCKKIKKCKLIHGSICYSGECTLYQK